MNLDIMSKTMGFSKETVEYLEDYTLNLFSNYDYDLQLSCTWKASKTYKIHIYALCRENVITYVSTLHVFDYV